MPHYIVTVGTRHGDYEKSIKSLRHAGNAEAAGMDAMMGQLHHELCPPGGDPDEYSAWFDIERGHVWDGGGEMVYEVERVVLVEEEDVRILKKYLSY